MWVGWNECGSSSRSVQYFFKGWEGGEKGQIIYYWVCLILCQYYINHLSSNQLKIYTYRLEILICCHWVFL